jgi:hypothetical protein
MIRVVALCVALLLPERANAADCLIVGDSIAKRLATVMRECRVSAEGGLTAREILPYVPQRSADVVVLSAGSNRPNQASLAQDLAELRSRVSGRVIWILPINALARERVTVEAGKHGDDTVSFEASRDGKHPMSYGDIATDLRKRLQISR